MNNLRNILQLLDEGEYVYTPPLKMSRVDVPVLYSKDDIKIVNSVHGSERMDQRNTLSTSDLEKFFSLITSKVKSLKNTSAEYANTLLFWSRSLHQGIIAAWDKVKNIIKVITFLPRNKHFSSDPNTFEVVVEGQTLECDIIFVD